MTRSYAESYTIIKALLTVSPAGDGSLTKAADCVTIYA